MSFDPRTIGHSVYKELVRQRKLYEDELKVNNALNKEDVKKHFQEQKSQAVELYTYISTWGLTRLRAEEKSLNKWKPNEKPTIVDKAVKSQEGKREIILSFFQCLEELSGEKNLVNDMGIATLYNADVDDYLGLTGLALALAQEFSFWATAVYWDIKGEQ
jgi:hypothetical protein